MTYRKVLSYSNFYGLMEFLWFCMLLYKKVLCICQSNKKQEQQVLQTYISKHQTWTCNLIISWIKHQTWLYRYSTVWSILRTNINCFQIQISLQCDSRRVRIQNRWPYWREWRGAGSWSLKKIISSSKVQELICWPPYIAIGFSYLRSQELFFSAT